MSNNTWELEKPELTWATMIALSAEAYSEGLNDMNEGLREFSADQSVIYNQDWITKMSIALLRIRSAGKRARGITGAPGDVARTLISMAEQYDRACVYVTKAIDERSPEVATQASETFYKANCLSKEVALKLRKYTAVSDEQDKSL